MDFFTRQDSARKQTGLLLVYFGIAVCVTILLVYFFPLVGFFLYRSQNASAHSAPFQWWQPELFGSVCGITLLVVGCGALFKIAHLRRSGGSGVAQLLGGKEILPSTDDFFEKRLRNVVEEMAIASGVPVPPVYVMEREKGINAFAAGFHPSDAVVAVTYGTMTGLTRDELQGVVAHEFSHILNNDMAINIKLMGFLHGLLLIGLTGQFILRMGGGSRHSKGSAPIFAAGLSLMIVGYTGVLCAKLIKASISRSRERLADASAVQFTRNAEGLANALKKIGGLSCGSRIRSSHAEEASHMFFGKGTKGSIFSTHPSLTERVRWLEPGFTGDFPTVTPEDLRKQLARFEGAPKAEQPDKKTDVVDLFTKPHHVAVTATVLGSAASPARRPAPSKRPVNPDALIASIGAPMQEHADAAQQLIQSIPETIKDYAREPYGARMLIYALLLDADKTIRDKQLAIIEEQAEPQVSQTLKTALSDMDQIQPGMRLPIIDLSIPALRFLSKNQYTAFRNTAKLLIEADEQVDLFEYALQRVLTHHLDPVFNGKPKPRVTNYYAIRGLTTETSIILSILARKGHENSDEVLGAFRDAAEQIDAPQEQLQLQDENACTWEALDAALDKINTASFQIKKQLLASSLICLMHDREITIEETELFRAIADTLGCPVPPWVSPTQKN